MSRYSSRQNPPQRRLDRSRSPQGGSDRDPGTTIRIEGAAAAVLERDEEILKIKFKKAFPTVHVILEKNHQKITFFGKTIKKADSMMFLFRYLSNEKKINCIR